MASVAMPRPSLPPLHEALSQSARRHVVEWYMAGAALGFAIPLVGADLLELHHDLYLLVYVTLAGTFLASFVAHTGLDWRGWLRTRLWWSVAAGVVVALASVRNVLGETGTTRPTGVFYWFELVWRGVVYGTMDALLLFVFPASVAYLLLRDSDRRRHLRCAIVTLLLSFGLTATYHLGYPQFRSTGLVQPEVGALVANIPAVLTGNPAGALVIHDAYHVAANIHTYRSPIFLPPDLDGYAERGSGAAGVVIAAGWIAAAAFVIYASRHRLFRRASEEPT